MKIIRIIARLNVGGPARHVVWLAAALNDDEFTSILVAGRVPPGEEDMGYIAAAHGVEPVYIEEMSRELSVKDIVSLVKVYHLLLREKPDIVHTHTAKAGTVGRTAAFLYRWLTPGTLIGRPRAVSVVHTFHGHVFHSYYGKAKTSVFILIEKLLARFATDRIVTISQQQYTEINREVGIGRADQFAVVPLGIDLGPYLRAADPAGLRNELGAKENVLLVGIVGRLTEIKNIPMFLEAAALYAQAADPDLPALRFVVAGDGHLRSGLEAQADVAGNGNVTFLGNRNDIENVYAGLDIVALTSLNEGTPLSLIEAMASSKAVISTVVGGVTDLLGGIVEEGDGFTVHERGIGVPSGKASDLVKGLIYLVKNERLRLELSKKGHEFVRANYGKDRLIEDIRLLYRGLGSGKGA